MVMGTRKTLSIYRTFDEECNLKEVYRLEYDHFDKSSVEYDIEGHEVDVDLIKRICNAIQNGLRIEYKDKIEEDFKFYVTNLDDEQEQELKETVENRCWGFVDISESSAFVTAFGEENKRKIKWFADSLINRI